MNVIEKTWPLILIWVAVPAPLYIWFVLWLMMG